jgi:hypothetical protein
MSLGSFEPRRRVFESPLRALWDVDLVNAGDGGALGDVWREQLERVLFAFGLNRPPNRVSTGAAGCKCGLVTERARKSFEGGEDDAALARLMTMLK